MSVTSRDMELAMLAWQCIKDSGAIKIDFQKLAQVGGFKTAASANTCWLSAKKKILAYDPTVTGTGSGTPNKPKAKAQAKTGKEKNATDAGSDDNDDQQFTTPSTGIAPKVELTDRTNVMDEMATSPVAEDHADHFVTPAVESDLKVGASVTQTPKKGKGKPKAASNVDNDSTPTKTAPKKRTPKVKVKVEDVAGDGSNPDIPKPKKRALAAKPEDNTDVAPKRAMKANGKSVQAPGRGSFAGAIAASNTLQDMIFGSDKEVDVGDEPTGAVREDEHVGVKETARKTAQGALDTMASQDGARKVLAHQDGMFDQDAADDELFTRYTNFKEEEEA